MVVISVHLGAGNFNINNVQSYSRVARVACNESIRALKNGSTALEGIEIAISNIENSPLTNAGYGSFLNNAGQVECDASVMYSEDHLFGALACGQNFYNPISLATAIVKFHQSSSYIATIPPIVISGKGALDWAIHHNLPTIKNEDLKTERTISRFAKGEARKADFPEDTVGAVCCDIYGHVAAGCSTGGPEFRCAGRVSHVSVYGAGCWAENCGGVKVAVSTSGMGEQLLASSLARSNAQYIFSHGFDDFTPDSQSQFLVGQFIGSKFIRRYPYKVGGSLVLAQSGENVKVVWGHSTCSMFVASMSCLDCEPKVSLSTLPDENMEGFRAVSEGFLYQID